MIALCTFLEIWVALVCALSWSVQAEGTYETEMVFEVYSSGARAPVNSNLFNESWIHKIGYGRITSVGMRQHYNLGAAVREKFGKLITNIVDMQHVKVYSSGRSRSLISATTHNQGLFPTGSRFGEDSSAAAKAKLARLQRIHPEFNGRLDDPSTQFAKNEFLSEPAPVPVESVDQFEDFMFLPRLDKACPHAKELRDSTRYMKFTQIHMLLTHFRDELGETVTSLKDPSESKSALHETIANFYLKTSFALNHIWDVVYSSFQYYGVLPSNFSELVYQKLRRLASGLFYLKFSEERIRKLYTTKISEKVIEILSDLPDWGSVNLRSPKYRYVGFAGDDDTVGSLLHMFEKANADCHFNAILNLEAEAEKLDPTQREMLERAGTLNSTLEELETTWTKSISKYEPNCQPIPPYSSSLIFEVVRFSGDGSLHVRMLHNMAYTTIIGESTLLPVEKFISLLRSRGIIVDFDELCGNKHFKIVKAGSFLLTTIVLILLTLCARAQVLKYKRIERHRANKTK